MISGILANIAATFEKRRQQFDLSFNILQGAKVIRYLLLMVLLPLWILPVFSLLYISLKPTRQIAQDGFWSFPETFALFSNLSIAWTDANFQAFAINSLLYATIGGLIAVFLASLAAFTLARLDVPGRELIFYLILLFMFFPFQMYLIPLVKMSHTTGLYNSRTGLIIVYVAIAIPFAVFLIRNYFVTLPESLYEAGRIDGLSTFQIYWAIYAPLAKPAFAVALIFQWVWIWNEFIFGLVLTSSDSTRPIATGLAMVGGRAVPWGVIAAGTILTAFPAVLIYVALQKYFERGLLTMT